MAYIPFPVGTVLPFAGATAPDGWLLYDGSAISQTTYPALFSVLSTTYDTQVNPTTNSAYTSPGAGLFRVPDYRASFLRGVGTPFAGDACTLGGWQVQKTARNGLNNASSSVTGTGAATGSGTLTGHNHTMSDPGHSHALGVVLGQGNAFTDNSVCFAGAVQTSNAQFTRSDPPGVWKSGSWMQNTASGASTTGANIDHSHSVSGTAAAQNMTGDNETRPHNKGVNYIIKF